MREPLTRRPKHDDAVKVLNQLMIEIKKHLQGDTKYTAGRLIERMDEDYQKILIDLDRCKEQIIFH